jgi:large subunit ribosomal protein L4
MATVPVYNLQGDAVSKLDLPDEIFANHDYDHLIHQVVRYSQAARRQGTHATKGRSAVRGGGKKVWKQKGTGRARHGGSRAPQFRGGGVAHGPQPRNYAFKLNKKVRRNALKSAISSRTRDARLFVFDSLELAEIKTRNVANLLEKLGVQSALVISGGGAERFVLSARNLPYIKVLPEQGLNVEDVVRHRHLILAADAVDALRRRLSA